LRQKKLEAVSPAELVNRGDHAGESWNLFSHCKIAGLCRPYYPDL